MMRASLIVMALCGTVALHAQVRGTEGAPLRELREDLDALVRSPEWAGANVGVAVLSLETGETIYRHDAEKYSVPASTQKLFTTATALATLGPSYRYRTQVYLQGDLQPNGEFVGLIIIRGSGDPTLSTAFGRDPVSVVDRWAAALDSIGIRSIRGTIIGDDDVFDDVEYAQGWSWDDFVYSYAPQVGGLGIADNAVRMEVIAPPRARDVPIVRLVPETDYVRIVNAVQVVDSTGRTDVKPYRDFRSNVVDLVGTVAMLPRTDTARVSVSVDNPTLYLLSHMRSALQRKGIRFRGSVADIDTWNDTIDYGQCRLVIDDVSPPLSEIVKVINTTSHNLGAEVLFKTLGREIGGEGSFDKGAEVVRRHVLAEGIAGPDIVIVDGSGLSRLNLCSPHQLVALLSHAFRAPWAAAFKASLATAGTRGTLRQRLVGTRAEKAVAAKTGGMNNVSNLAGYVTTRDGEPFAFAIMMNHFIVQPTMAQNLQDLICMRLASFARR